MAILTLNAKLSYDASSTETPTWTDLTNLLEIPALGGSKDSIEVTSLSDSAHVYINGLESYGDSLAFKFNYDKVQYNTLAGFGDAIKSWKVTLPDNSTVTFSGACDVQIETIAVNQAIQYTLNIKPNTAMTYTAGA